MSLHCTSGWHHREYCQYLPSGHSGKPTPQCQAVRAALFGKWGLTACNAFSIVSSEPSSPSLPWEPVSREQRPHSTICYLVATGLLHLMEPQTSLPAGYPADYASCITDHPVCDANCLAVSPCVHCSLSPGKASRELRGWKGT